MKIKNLFPSSDLSSFLSGKSGKIFLSCPQRFFYESQQEVNFEEGVDSGFLAREVDRYSFNAGLLYLCATARDLEDDDGKVFLFKAAADFTVQADSFALNEGILVVLPFQVFRQEGQKVYLYSRNKDNKPVRIGAYISSKSGFFVPSFGDAEWEPSKDDFGWCCTLDTNHLSIEFKESDNVSAKEEMDDAVNKTEVELVDNLYDEVPVSLRFRVSDFIDRESVQFFQRDESIHEGNEMLIVSRKMPGIIKNSIRGWGFSDSEGDGKPSVSIFDANEGFKDLHSLMYTIDYKSLVTEDPFSIGMRSFDGRCSPDSYAVAIIMEELLETINVLSPEINWRMSNYIDIVCADVGLLVSEYKDLRKVMFSRWSKQLPMSFVIKTKLLLRCSFDVFYKAFDAFAEFAEKTKITVDNVKAFFERACETYQIITGIKLSENTQISFRACKNPSLLNKGLIKEILEDGVVARFLVPPQAPMTDPVLSTLSKFFSPEYLDYIKILEKVVAQAIEELLL